MLSAVITKWYNKKRILKDSHDVSMPTGSLDLKGRGQYMVRILADSLDVSKPTGSLDLKVGGSIWKREEENVYNSGTWKSEA